MDGYENCLTPKIKEIFKKYVDNQDPEEQAFLEEREKENEREYEENERNIENVKVEIKELSNYPPIPSYEDVRARIMDVSNNIEDGNENKESNKIRDTIISLYNKVIKNFKLNSSKFLIFVPIAGVSIFYIYLKLRQHTS
eukprot:TRINITY_DN16178_c0_g1_i1.p1 TRINITY_DN16178_c0_g1~~TRINITY_DN16178_c0_g1_i1.p1  ORF type:complete len:140 (-),score=36.82 TRINITY_DN16178_c0_g1_i1:25-444(-)